MSRTRENPAPSEKRLGILAMRFRGTNDAEDRQNIARDYAHAVKELIDRGTWNEIPAPEDQLPDEWMPEAFFTHWSLSPPDVGANERPKRQGPKKKTG